MKKEYMVYLLFIAVFQMSYAGEKLASTIYLNNSLNIKRIDETFVIERNDLGAQQTALVPVVISTLGDTIPSQLDDIDRDGEWDELSFEYTLSANEEDKLVIKWTSPAEYPVFPMRTNIRYGKVTSPGKIEELRADFHTNKEALRKTRYPYQLDGVAWENDKMGFRLYFDGRNSRDVFGKRIPEMVLDTVGIGYDGYPTNSYQVPNKWGRDVLNVGKSFGLGGLALASSDTIIPLGDIETGRRDNVDTSVYQLIIEGPVRSVFRIVHKGWHVGQEKIDITQEVTIWGGKYYYENKVLAKAIPSGFNLITGIVRNRNREPLETEKNKSFYAMLTHDQQTTDPRTYMGMALIIPNSNFIKAFDTPESGANILSTWCAKLIPDSLDRLYFDVYAVWDQGDRRFNDRAYYIDFIKQEMLKKSYPVRVKLR